MTVWTVVNAKLVPIIFLTEKGFALAKGKPEKGPQVTPCLRSNLCQTLEILQQPALPHLLQQRLNITSHGLDLHSQPSPLVIEKAQRTKPQCWTWRDQGSAEVLS
jgi:hypothetical protein